VVVEPGRLAPDRTPVDAGASAGRGTQHVGEVHDETAASPHGSGDGMQFGRVWRVRVGHEPAFSHGSVGSPGILPGIA
jgi:hypothetical protein